MKTKFSGILTLLLAFVVQISFAQDKLISGTVSDETGPLPGVSILKKGTTEGTETDFDGKYSVNAKVGDILVFSFVGMKVIEKKVGASNKIDVQMQSGNQLEEVVVLGYNSKSKEVLSSGVSTVTTEELSQVNSTTNVANALQGKAAGVVVTAANGKPGENAFVRIRGIGSINAGQEPLYIVDGIPVTEKELNLINNSDIESMSVLKDAASASIYGSRASNGVVVITTKSGKNKEKAKITFSSQIGFSEKVKDNFTMMNAEQKLRYEKEISDGRGLKLPGKSALPGSLEHKQLLALNHDWQSSLLKKGIIKSNGISISGGTEKSKYFISFKSDSDSGIIKGLDGYNRIMGRINFTSELNNWLNLRLNTGVSHTSSKEPRDRNNIQNPFFAMYSYNPYQPLYKVKSFDKNGSPKFDSEYNLTRHRFSISEALKNNPESEERLRFIGGIGLDFKALNNKITYTPQVSMTYTTLRGEYYVQPNSVLNKVVGDLLAPGSKRDTGNYNFTYNLLNKISYNDTYSDVHNLGITVLSEFFSNNFRSYRVSSKGFPSKDLTTQDNASEADGRQITSRNEKSLFSIAGALDYNYNEKYITSLSIRRDGSSMFGENNKYGIFWAASAAWNIHKEDFFNFEPVNSLKLRVSYGTVGNDRLPNRYGYLNSYKFSNYNGQTAAYPHNVPNPDLKWEEKAIFDLGLDFSLFNRRLNGVINYFSSKTSDLLFLESLAQEAGEPGSRRYSNFGGLSSSGLEIELNGSIIKNENLTWDLGGTIAFVKNKVDELPNGADYIPTGYDLILQEGKDIYTHYLVRYAGVNSENGRSQYYDKNGNITEKYDPSDAVPLAGKSVSPDFDGSFNTKIDYKGINLSANFYYRFGNYIYNNQEQQHLSDGNSASGNQRVDALNYWKKPGDTNVLPDPRNKLNTSENSDRFLQEGSYIRLRSIKLGYDIPKKWLDKTNLIKSISFYLQGQNLWTYTPHFKGDPEVGIGSGETINSDEIGFVPGAYNLNSYPTTKSYILGLDISF